MRRRNNEAAMVVVVLVVAYVYSHGSGTGSGKAHPTAGQTTTSANARLGQQMAAADGWTGSQWSCLNWLWTRESGWSSTAANAASDARGIAQDINGWSASYPYGDAAAQITWGLNYIRGRYGNPCNAWSHETADGWY
jgi:resuscitation-promoting factor RpfB